ncbi:MAG: hypothetical protein K9K62_08845 [Desulfobacteraceae bacterium]|nr:hypothetical protein [Desulfobacteraceae bacterium]
MTRWHEISANRRALAYILFSAIVLGAMLFLGVMPTRQQIADAEKKTERLKARIEKQEIFHPLYRRLQEKLEAKQEADIADQMPASGTTEFTIENVSKLLSDMAVSAGIPETSFSPAPESMSRGSDRLLVHGQMQGNYQNFRDFLIKLVTAPDFQAFEILEVQSGTRHPNYRMQIWVTVK